MIVVRDVSRDRFRAEPGSTRFLRVPERARTPKPSHAARTKGAWVKEVLKKSRNGANPHDADPDGDILIFIHGYNNSPAVVLARQRRLAADLSKQGFDGVVVGFDWPSGKKALNYLEDRSDARQTALRLVKDGILLFANQQANGCTTNVHLLAHSTGAFVIREAFDDADDHAEIATVSWSVSQIMLIGADVSRAAMSTRNSKSSSIYRHCVRLTNYSNPFDKVLKLSNIKRIGVAPRAGRVGLPGDIPDKAVNVNCGMHFSQLHERDDAIGSWSHSWHIGDTLWTEDVLHTIRGDVDRQYVPTRRRSGDGDLILRESITVNES